MSSSTSATVKDSNADKNSQCSEQMDGNGTPTGRDMTKAGCGRGGARGGPCPRGGFWFGRRGGFGGGRGGCEGGRGGSNASRGGHDSQ